MEIRVSSSAAATSLPRLHPLFGTGVLADMFIPGLTLSQHLKRKMYRALCTHSVRNGKRNATRVLEVSF